MEDLEPPVKIINELPVGFFETLPRDLHKILPGPTLIKLKSENNLGPLFISTLLHGNETTGFLALQKLLKKHLSNGEIIGLKRPLYIFIGNPKAASKKLRTLPSQIDHNRIWRGGEKSISKLPGYIIPHLDMDHIFASIDIHNTSGRNPLYSAVNRLTPKFLSLASEFSEIIVYFTEPADVLSNSMAHLCPSVILECGADADKGAIDKVVSYINRVMDLEEFKLSPDRKFKLYQSIATIKVPKETIILFGVHPTKNSISFIGDLDMLNFKELPEATMIARTEIENFKFSIEFNDNHEPIEIFELKNGEILTKGRNVLSMLTLNPHIILDDCFAYLMKEISIS